MRILVYAMKKQPTKVISFRTSPDTVKQLERAAKKRKKNRSEFVKEAVTNAIENTLNSNQTPVAA